MTSSPLSIMRAAAILDYLFHSDEVEGWCSGTTGLGIVEILWQQEQRGVAGNLAEIGIHHGKSFLFLAGAARPSETAFAIDVFDRQDLNLDYSGRGDLAQFRANLTRFFPGARVSIIAESSADLAGREAEFGLLGLRFLSIDGGHTRALTINDLRLADTCLADQGVCCLDDVLNAHWTGVVSGLFDFLGESKTLVPFVLFPNKLFFCRPAHESFYRDFIRGRFARVLERTDLEFGDSTIDVVGEALPLLGSPFGELCARLAEAKIHAAETKIAAAEARAEEARRLIEALRASTSWRLTAPLRALRRLLPR